MFASTVTPTKHSTCERTASSVVQEIAASRKTNVPARYIPPPHGSCPLLQSVAGTADNRRVPTPARKPATPPNAPLFSAGVLVLVTLNTPREKFWGAILDVSPSGVSLRGIDLNSFDDFAGMVRAGEAATASAVFFPMHRLERMEADTRNGDIPSLRERFELKAGRTLGGIFGDLALGDEEA